MAKSSPFEGVHKQLSANFAEYDGWRLPKDYGNPAAETTALQQSAAAFDLSSFGRFSIPVSAAPALTGLIPPSVALPDDGTWIRTTLNGSLAVRISRIRNQFLVFSLPSMRSSLFDTLTKQVNLTGGSVNDLTEKTGMLALYGPTAFASISKIIPMDLSGLQPGCVVTHSFFMISITALRGGWVGSDGLELICPSSAAGLAAGAVAKYHKQQNITPAGMDCLMRAIENNVKI
jgi:aminomethyltransferase